jgi:hypothetical protein
MATKIATLNKGVSDAIVDLFRTVPHYLAEKYTEDKGDDWSSEFVEFEHVLKKKTDVNVIGKKKPFEQSAPNEIRFIFTLILDGLAEGDQKELIKWINKFAKHSKGEIDDMDEDASHINTVKENLKVYLISTHGIKSKKAVPMVQTFIDFIVGLWLAVIPIWYTKKTKISVFEMTMFLMGQHWALGGELFNDDQMELIYKALNKKMYKIAAAPRTRAPAPVVVRTAKKDPESESESEVEEEPKKKKKTKKDTKKKDTKKKDTKKEPEPDSDSDDEEESKKEIDTDTDSDSDNEPAGYVSESDSDSE